MGIYDAGMRIVNNPTAMAVQPRQGLILSLTGTAIAWAAMATYFLVVPRWPDLRDSGIPSEVLGALGVVLGAGGLVRSFRARQRRSLCAALFGMNLLAAGLLPVYIHWLSWRIPSEAGVVTVGARAPAFPLSDQDGRPWTLEEFRGRKLLLVFFRGHW